jgi:gluconolactonase
MSEWTLVTDGLRFPEGPVALPNGDVLVVEIERGTLTRVAPDGTKTVAGQCGGGPNGAAMGPDNKVYICNNGGFVWTEIPQPDGTTWLLPGDEPPSYIGGRIQTVDLASGEVRDLYTEYEGRGLRGPNDIVFDAHGGFYFTDLGKGHDWNIDRGAVYYAKADGSSLTRLAFPLDHPNGCSLSPDGSRLYVCETVTGRVWFWDLEAPGVAKAGGMMFGPSGGSLLGDLPGFQLIDSMAVDSEGNLCLATLIKGCITVMAPDGTIVRQVAPPRFDPLVTNICFGGPDLRTAYVTVSGVGHLYATEWPVPGLALHHLNK